MPRFKLVDGVKVQFTPEEETQRDTDEAEALVERQSTAHKAPRQKEYGYIGDQLDEIFKDIDAWKTRIQTIKDKYPKE
tara:strand:+ start:462 stop:695 length:234 start_codon:yes stop_codon:yes gene_type:complete